MKMEYKYNMNFCRGKGRIVVGEGGFPHPTYFEIVPARPHYHTAIPSTVGSFFARGCTHDDEMKERSWSMANEKAVGGPDLLPVGLPRLDSPVMSR